MKKFAIFGMLLAATLVGCQSNEDVGDAGARPAMSGLLVG